MFSLSALRASLPFFSNKPAPSDAPPPTLYAETDDLSPEMSQVSDKPQNFAKPIQKGRPKANAPPALETLDERISAFNRTEFCGDWTLKDARKFLFLKDSDDTLPRFRAPLYPFQLLGVAHLRKHELGTAHQREEGSGITGGAVLADEMGLGKTIQVLGTISLEEPDPSKKTLIVVPASLIHHWEHEIKTKLIGFKVCVFHGTKFQINKNSNRFYDNERRISPCRAHFDLGPDKQKIMKEFDDANIVLRTYEGLRDEWKNWKASSENTASPPKSPAGKGVTQHLFYKTTWYRIVLDEAQNIRNRQTATSRAVLDLKAKFKHAITGTLIYNTLGDAYALCKFLEIPKLMDEITFDGFITYVEKEQPYKAAEFLRKHFIQKYVLRRMKETVLEGKKLLELPPMIEQTMWFALSSAERGAYDSISHRESLSGNDFYIPNWVLKSVSLWTERLRQRQLCIHPCLIQKPEDKDDPPQKPNTPPSLDVNNRDMRSVDSCRICGECDLAGEPSYISCPCGNAYCHTCIRETSLENGIRDERETHDIGVIRMKCLHCGKHLDTSTIDVANCVEEEAGISPADLSGVFRPSTKFERALSLLEAWKEDPKTSSDKTVIISEFTSALDLMGMYLSMNGIPYLQYDGRMKAPQRADTVRDFLTDQKPDVLLLSRKAGGLGLNLTRANRVILLDPWWNLPVEDQAVSRCHRIGQTKPVYVYRLFMEDTIEQDMVEKYQVPKRVLARAAYGEY